MTEANPYKDYGKCAKCGVNESSEYSVEIRSNVSCELFGYFDVCQKCISEYVEHSIKLIEVSKLNWYTFLENRIEDAK